MKVLLDESLDVRLRMELTGHDAFTVGFLGWKGLKNGALLSKAAADGFEALITVDRNIEHQQNLSTLPCAVIVLIAPSGQIDHLRPLVPNLLSALSLRPSKKVVHVQP